MKNNVFKKKFHLIFNETNKKLLKNILKIIQVSLNKSKLLTLVNVIL